MSRTFRNKNTVPHGWYVRDGGRPCRVNTSRKSIADWWDVPPYRRYMYCCEVKWVRKVHYKKFRLKSKRVLWNEDWDNMPEFRRTSGWLSW